MKVLVTGGNGRIGKSVVKALVDHGHEVVILDRRPADRPGAKFIFIDLRDRQFLQPVMEQADTIIHMGEIPDVRSGGSTEEQTFGHNCTVGAQIFQIASELKYKRVIYTSTIQIYGITGHNRIPPVALPVDENHPRFPRNGYGLAKCANEDYARMCSEQRGLSVAVFRLPWVMTHDPEEGWFEWADRKQKLQDDMGMYVRDSDVAGAFVAAIDKPRPGFEVYNLGARETMHNAPIREAIEREYPGHPKLPENWGKYQNVYSSAKAQEHFGWEAKWNFLDEFRKKMGRDPEPK